MLTRLSVANTAWIGQPKVSFGVINLQDERGVVSALFVAEDNFYAVYNRPRTFDLRLELSF